MFTCYRNNPVNKIDPDGYFLKDIWYTIGKAAYWLYYNVTKWHFEDREQGNGDHPSYTEVTSDGSLRLLPSRESIYHDNGIVHPKPCPEASKKLLPELSFLRKDVTFCQSCPT